MTTKEHGIILIEGLISILIFSLGILSIVAMLGVSIKNTSSAKYRTEASLLANQIIGQMETGDRANAALTANFSSPGGQNFVTWQAVVTNTLPGVAGANLPTISIAPDNTATITVRWQAPGDNVAHQYVVLARIAG
jgi:type IV pilus assembly protein PilV